MLSLLRRKPKRGPYFSTSGKTWRLAYALVALADDFDRWLPEGATWQGHAVYGPSQRYVGTLGNEKHRAEGWTKSDHNPFIRHGGVGIVRAMDVNFGNQDLNDYVRDVISAKYWAKDSRLWSRGYGKSNYRITANAEHGGGLHKLIRPCTPGDPGHVHISLTRDGDSGYAPSIDSTAPWGFASAPKSTLAPAPVSAPPRHAVPDTLLEFIMSLPGAPAGLTYQQLLHDVATATVDQEIDRLWRDGNVDPKTKKGRAHGIAYWLSKK